MINTQENPQGSPNKIKTQGKTQENKQERFE